jgi:anti-sigma B factor antagonist
MPLTPREHVQAETIGDVTVIRFKDDRLVADEDILEFEAEINRLTDGLAPRVLLDFKTIRQMSSSALGKILALRRKIAEARGEFKLCRLSADLREVFEITKLNQTFPIFDDEASALKSFH